MGFRSTDGVAADVRRRQVMWRATPVIVGLMALFLFLPSLGSIGVFRSFLQGESFSISPTILHLGRVIGDSTAPGRLTIVNRSGRAIELVGHQASCNCLVVGQSRRTVAANSHSVIDVRIERMGREKIMVGSEQLVFFLNVDGQLRSVPVTVRWSPPN